MHRWAAQFVLTLSRAAVAIGVGSIYGNPSTTDKAASDDPNMIPLDHMPALIKTLLDFDILPSQR